LIYTCHAAPISCHDHAFLKATFKGHGATRHGMCELASDVQDGMWETCQSSTSSGYHAEFHQVFYQKNTNPLKFRTSSSDISGYHADLNEGHGTGVALHV
jgi:hypothetical protein